MAQSHLTKAELRQDLVQDTLLDGVDYLQRHLRTVILFTVAAVVVVAAGIAYYVYLQHVAQEQSAAYYAAEKVLATPNLPQEERLKQTEAAMEAFLKANPSAKLAPAAYGYLARFAVDRKDYAKAEEVYQKILAHSQTDATQRTITLLSLGKLKAVQGKPADGLTFFNQIADKRFEDAKAYAVGTANLASGKPEDARKQFQQAATTQPNTSVSTWAKEALDYLP